MDKKNLLLGLIEKKTLNDQDKALLKTLLDEKELRDFYDLYFKTGEALNEGVHISIDDLRDYVLVKNNLPPENQSIFSRINSIEDHIRQCTSCKLEFTTLNSEFTDIDNYITGQFREKKEAVFTPLLSRKIFRSGFLVAAVVIIGFLYLVVFSLSEFTTPAAYKFASGYNEDYYVTRGRATDDFQKATFAYEEGRLSDAINYLETDIRNNPNDGTIFYSHYILGITYLRAAGKDILGLFPSYDPELAKNGLRHLNLAVEKNTSGKFNNITTESYYHIGRAYLMLNDPSAAKKYFSLVIKNKGSRMNEAEQILSGIDE